MTSINAAQSIRALANAYAERHAATLGHIETAQELLKRRAGDYASWAQDYALRTGSPVIRAGNFELHYATPVGHTSWAELGDPYPVENKPLETFSVAAVDGSQIFPPTEARYPFTTVRIGAVAINYGNAAFPQNRLAAHRQVFDYAADEAQLFDALLDDGLRPGERNTIIAGFRDHMEFHHAVQAVDDLDHPGQRIVMLDRPLHPFDPTSAAAKHIDMSLGEIMAKGAIPVGVVSGGDARYVTRLLGAVNGVDTDKAWPRVTDRMVMSVLLDGHRTAPFRIASEYNERAAHPIGFVYLRVGFEVLRVEFPLTAPNWRDAVTAVQRDSVGLHYPYVLIHAHQVAIITGAEARAMTQTFQDTLAAYGIYDDLLPNAKADLKGKK